MKYLKSYINAIKYIKDIATFKEENIPSLKFSDETYEEKKNYTHHIYNTIDSQTFPGGKVVHAAWCGESEFVIKNSKIPPRGGL